MKTRNDNPVRDYDFYELQRAGETRWTVIESWNDGESLKTVQGLAAIAIKEKMEWERNLKTFIDLGCNGPFRLVKVIKHCKNVPLK